MCIPTRKLSPTFSNDNASSKSLAVSGSIVNVNTSRMSSLLSISFLGISSRILLASDSTSSSKLYGKPYSCSIECISTSLLPTSPKTSIILPFGFLAVSPQLVNLAIAFCPSVPPFNFDSGIYKSVCIFGESGIRNANLSVTCNLPTNVVLNLSTTSITLPSSFPSLPDIISISTISRCNPLPVFFLCI